MSTLNSLNSHLILQLILALKSERQEAGISHRGYRRSARGEKRKEREAGCRGLKMTLRLGKDTGRNQLAGC